MPLSFPAPSTLALLTVGLFIAVPKSSPLPQRNGAADTVRLKTATCQYRGITATFEELTQAYAIEAFEDPRLLRWEARTSPHNPDAETLVTAVFAHQGPKEGPRGLRATGVTWRLNDMTGVHIAPYNGAADEAIATFRHTVERFLGQMVVVSTATARHRGPSAAYATIDTVAAGQILLRQEADSGWLRVRPPSGHGSSGEDDGWVPQDRVQPLYGDE